MWRAFGNNPARVGLVLNIPWYSESAIAAELSFSPIGVTEPEIYKLIQKITESITANSVFLRSVDRQIIIGQVFQLLVSAVTCHKASGRSGNGEVFIVLAGVLQP